MRDDANIWQEPRSDPGHAPLNRHQPGPTMAGRMRRAITEGTI
jgi:hypothetical protein